MSAENKKTDHKRHDAEEVSGEAKAENISEVQKEIADLVAALKESHEQALLQRADFENIKKRLERDKMDAIKFANEKLLGEVLGVVDNFDRAMTSLSEGHDPAKVQQGLKITQQELHKVLEMNGVQVIEAAGKPFDPMVHEAVATADDGKTPEGFVIDEVQRGYLLNGRLIRPSRVRISQK